MTMTAPLRIDQELCIGCGACIEACPQGALALLAGVAAVNERCIACGLCLSACPVEALSLPAPEAPSAAAGASGGVWVWVEQQHTGVAEVSWELLARGRILADACRAELVACVLGAAVDEVARAAVEHGADRVLQFDSPSLADFRAEAYAHVLRPVVEARQPAIMLFGATTRGRDLAGSLAADLHTGLTADCTELHIDAETGLLVQTRPAYGGNIMATILTPATRPQMATVRPRVFEPAVPVPGRVAPIERLPVTLAEYDLLSQVLAFAPSTSDENLASARVIVAGGKGVGNAEGFGLLSELAALLGGAVGASRAAVDAGWIGYEHQVGQTGRTVRPELYLACGISGAIQHRAGMSTSRVIVAINTDPQAPIFDIATYGIVGDLFQVVPALISALRSRISADGGVGR